MKKLVFLAGAGALVTGIVMWGKYQAKLVDRLVYGIKNAKLRKVGVSQVTADFDFQIDNPTEFKIEISNIDIDVFANNILVSKVRSKKETMLAPHGSTFVPLTLDLSPKDLVKSTADLLTIATSLDSTKIDFKGFIKVRKFGLKIPVPFTYNTTYKELKG